MKRIICQSGLMGWECRLRENDTDHEEWKAYSQTYNLAGRLGFDTAEEAWESNPLIEGSVNPSDFRRVA